MKAEYTIQFPEGLRTFRNKCPYSYIPNRIRSEYAKIEGAENAMKDTDIMNQVLAVILDTGGIDFSEANGGETAMVLVDFFESLTPKTKES